MTGRALYAGDRRPENLAYGYLLTSTVAKGSIQAMETSVAERSPGVAAVYTPFNPLKLYGGLEPSEGASSGEIQPVLQDRRILNYGQIIGLIVADSFEQARDAAALVQTRYAVEEPVASWEKGSKHSFTPDSVGGEKATINILANGVQSIDDAIKSSPVVMDATYTEPIYHHNPMEPHATTAEWHGDRLTIYDATQGVVSHRLDVAAVLGIDEDMVRVLCPFVGGGFGCKPPAPTSGGSTSVASVTPAIQRAAESAKKKLIQLAIREKKSPFYGMQLPEVAYKDGELVGGGKSVDFGSVLSAIRRSAVEAVEMAGPGDEEEKYAFHSFGAQFCELKVNRWTSEVRLQRFTSVMDIGTVVNLKTARSQIMGGIVFGIGMALLEGSDLEAKTGRYANANFADYLVATNADVPEVDVHFVIKPDTIFNPLGARGIGEIGVTGTPAAIANAVYNATGVRIREFPIRPEKLLPVSSNRPAVS